MDDWKESFHMSDITDEDGDTTPSRGDGDREALIARCIEMNVSVRLQLEFMRWHKHEDVLPLYRAAGLDPHLPDELAELKDLGERLTCLNETLQQGFGLTEFEMNRRLAARWNERFYPIKPADAPQPPLLDRTLRKCYLALSWCCRKLNLEPRAILTWRGGQRDLYH